MVAEIMEKENQTNKESYESECRAHMIGIKKVIYKEELYEW